MLTQKTIKPMNNTSLSLACQKGKSLEVQINMLLLKTFLFISREKNKAALQKQWTQINSSDIEWWASMP